MRTRPDITPRHKAHDEMAGEVVKTLVGTFGTPTSDPRELLVVTESIVTAILVIAVKPGHEEAATQILMRNAIERVRYARAMARPAEGSA